MTIYTTFTPTYLYVKTHNTTGLKYFGKTIKSNFATYKGSGRRWLNHIRKHGYDVTTELIGFYTDAQQCIDVATQLSAEWDIVNSDKWANIIPENGINGGGDCSQMHTASVRDKVRATSLNRYGVEYAILTTEARTKMTTTITKRYGKPGGQFSTPDSIQKRNSTNETRWGNKCAANRDGGAKSQETNQLINQRPEVQALKVLCKLRRIKLQRNWWRKSVEWLTQKHTEIEHMPMRIVDASAYTNTQLTRHKLLMRSNVIRLMQLKCEQDLHLGQNWFQKSDDWVNQQIIKYTQSVAGTVLQT